MRRVPADRADATVRDTIRSADLGRVVLKISSRSSAIRMFSRLPRSGCAGEGDGRDREPNDYVASNGDHRCADAQRHASSPSGSGRMLHSGVATLAV
jgi:hypothetical protein